MCRAMTCVAPPIAMRVGPVVVATVAGAWSMAAAAQAPHAFSHDAGASPRLEVALPPAPTIHPDGRRGVLPTFERWKAVCGSRGSMTDRQLALAAARHKAVFASGKGVVERGRRSGDGGLDIVFRFAPGVPSAAQGAAEAVAQYFEARLSDPVRVTVNISFDDLGGGGTLGITGSTLHVISWASSRTRLLADRDGDDTIQSSLPSGATIPVRFDGNSPGVTGVNEVRWVNPAWRAVGGQVSAFDPDITFNTQVSFDFDPSDGVTPGTSSFRDVLAHELGHALGFTSGVDNDPVRLEVLDLFRFQTTAFNPSTPGEFQTFPRILDPNTPVDAHHSDLVSVEHRMADGLDGNGGNLDYQASHFRATGNSSTAIGTMVPFLTQGDTFFPLYLRAPDLQMLDAIGWDWVCDAPRVTGHPSPQNVCFGSTAQFSVAATGTDVTYRWRRNGTPLNGAAARQPTLVLTNVGVSQAGNYDCVATSFCGSVTSDAAALTVGSSGPAITAQPDPVRRCAGQQATFQISASGGALTYQWRKGTMPISNSPRVGGATTRALTITGLVPTDAGNYNCVVTNACGVATSANALLTLGPGSAAPAGVAATGDRCDGVRVSWAAVCGASGYEVFRAPADTPGNRTRVATTDASPWVDISAAVGVSYVYTVRALGAECPGTLSSPQPGLRVAGAPASPVGVTASDGTNCWYVRVAWNAVGGATGYEVWRGTTVNPAHAVLLSTRAPVAPFAFYDATAEVAVQYRYFVRAIAACGAGAFSEPDPGRRPGRAISLATPTGVAASDGTFCGWVRVGWTAVAGAEQYAVWRSETPNPNAAVRVATVAAPPYFDTSVDSGLTRHYFILAESACSRSVMSAGNSGFAATAGQRWGLLSPPNAPTPRSLHSLEFDAIRGAAVMVGGFTTAPVRETWEFRGGNWALRAVNGPAARYGAASAFDSLRGRTVIYGGSNFPAAPNWLSDTWEWSGTAWSQRPVCGPGARFRAAMAYDAARGECVLFGGFDGTTSLGDTWVYDGTTWTLAATTGPSARVGHAMAYDSRRRVVVMFGGNLGQTEFGDTWEWDGSTWAQRAGGPPARTGHALAHDSRRGVVVMQGGRGASLLGDTWEWDGASWQAAPSGAGARQGHEMAFDAGRSRVLMFGGATAAGATAHTWEYRADCAESGPGACLADCDVSTGIGVLDVLDFVCFMQRFRAGDPEACGCDETTGVGVCDVFDVLCFQSAFSEGCG